MEIIVQQTSVTVATAEKKIQCCPQIQLSVSFYTAEKVRCFLFDCYRNVINLVLVFICVWCRK